MARLAGRVALVTGAAAGIGAACAATLARDGAAVLLTDLDAARGEATAARIRDAGGRARFLPQDVTEEAGWVALVDLIGREHGRLDVLVANAGIAIQVPSVTDMSLQDWRRLMAVNVEAVFLGVKHSLPLMRRAGHGGSIVMMSSIAGIRGSAGLACYSASKGAVRLFAKSVAMECAAMRDGIRCNSVHPGIIETAIWEKMPAGETGVAPRPAIDARALAASIVPLGEPGTPQDVADAVLFLASDESRHMTGAEMVVDGGMGAGRPGPPPR